MTSPRERRLQDFERRDLTSEMSHHADVHDQQEANTPGVAPLPFAPRYGYGTLRHAACVRASQPKINPAFQHEWCVYCVIEGFCERSF